MDVSWTTKKAECRRIDAFELWCWRRILRVPWTERRSNQSILKEISPDNSLEGLMLKLKLQYFGHLMGKTFSFEKTLMLGKIAGVRKMDDRGWDGWVASPTQWTWIWVNSGVGAGQEGLSCCSSWGRKELDTTKPLHWTELTIDFPLMNQMRWSSCFVTFKGGCKGHWSFCLPIFSVICLGGIWLPACKDTKAALRRDPCNEEVRPSSKKQHWLASYLNEPPWKEILQPYLNLQKTESWPTSWLQTSVTLQARIIGLNNFYISIDRNWEVIHFFFFCWFNSLSFKVSC